MGKLDRHAAAKFYESHLGIPRPLIRYRCMMGFPKSALGATAIIDGDYANEPFNMPACTPGNPVKKPVKTSFK